PAADDIPTDDPENEPRPCNKGHAIDAMHDGPHHLVNANKTLRVPPRHIIAGKPSGGVGTAQKVEMVAIGLSFGRGLPNSNKIRSLRPDFVTIGGTTASIQTRSGHRTAWVGAIPAVQSDFA